MTVAVLGVFVFTEIVYKRPGANESLEKEALKTDTRADSDPTYFELDKLIINLNTPGSRLRFLDVKISIVPFVESTNDIFEKSKPYITDSIIDIASNMKPSELNSIAGKILLEERIRKRLNNHFNDNLVRKIFFTRFVVQ